MRGEAVILFDIDGTLVDTDGAGRRSLDRVLAEMFGPGAPLASRDLAGQTDRAILRAALADRGCGDGSFERRFPEFFERYTRALVEELGRQGPQSNPPAGRVLPGVREALAALAERDSVHLGLLTGNVRAGAKAKLEAFGLWERFAFGGFGDDAEHRPDLLPVALARASARAGRALPAACAVVVGDTPHDVAVARAHGARAVAVATGRGYDLAALAKCEPDALFADITDTAAFLAACGL